MAGHKTYTFNEVSLDHTPERIHVDHNPNQLSKSGPKVSCRISADPSHEELKLLQQMGVTHCFCWINDDQINYNYLKSLKQKVNAHELILYNVQNRNLSKNIHIILNTKYRDREIKKWIEFMELISSLGIYLTVFTWESLGIVFTTHYNLLRGNTKSRAFDQNKLDSLSNYIDNTANEKLSSIDPETLEFHYSEEQLWNNMKYFLQQILPYCDKYKVRLALHPNDPPIPWIGIGGKYKISNIIRNKQSYEKVYKIADNYGYGQWLGMEFCCGCWLEGGNKGFGDIYQSIKEYVDRNKICVVHLRNVTSSLPAFTETIIDEGYGDIFKIINILVNNGYDGTIILDHTPDFVIGDKTTAACFAIGYIKSAINSAQHMKLHSKL